MRRSYPALTAMLITIVATGCSLTGTDLKSQASIASDTTPPIFAGLKSVHSDGLTRAVLSWNKASDETSPESNIIYLIWAGGQPNVPTDGLPSYVAPPRVTSFEVANLPAFQPTYFVVRAKDSAGNLDGNSTTMAASSTSGVWDFVDGGSVKGLATQQTIAASSVIASVGDRLYAMWGSNMSPVGPWSARVAVYNGNDVGSMWTSIDRTTNSGINYSSSNDIDYFSPKIFSLAPFNSRLYAGWIEFGGGQYQFRVAFYDPKLPLAGWTNVERSPADQFGLNYMPSMQAQYPALVATDGTLFAVWAETNGTVQQVRAAEYNGNDSAPAWTFIDGGTPNGINFDPLVDGLYPTAVGYNNHLVAAWSESNILHVMAYDGSSWSDIDGTGTGLNYTPGSSPYQPSLGVADGKLYLTWAELDSVTGWNTIRVREFNGDFSAPSWSFIDGGGPEGISIDPGQASASPKIGELNGGLVVAYEQTVPGSPTPPTQVRVRAYNGDANNPLWQTIDSNPSGGLNFNPGYPATHPSPAGFAGKLYVSWVESVDGGPSDFGLHVSRGR